MPSQYNIEPKYSTEQIKNPDLKFDFPRQATWFINSNSYVKRFSRFITG